MTTDVIPRRWKAFEGVSAFALLPEVPGTAGQYENKCLVLDLATGAYTTGTIDTIMADSRPATPEQTQQIVAKLGEWLCENGRTPNVVTRPNKGHAITRRHASDTMKRKADDERRATHDARVAKRDRYMKGAYRLLSVAVTDTDDIAATENAVLRELMGVLWTPNVNTVDDALSAIVVSKLRKMEAEAVKEYEAKRYHAMYQIYEEIRVLEQAAKAADWL